VDVPALQVEVTRGREAVVAIEAAHAAATLATETSTWEASMERDSAALCLKDAKDRVALCHTRFLCQNQVLIVCMTQDQLFHTYGQNCSQITKCQE
jgi:hypothetical protein